MSELNNGTHEEGIKNLITENELAELFGISKAAIGNLRRTRMLPFYKISNTARLYSETDVIRWLKYNRKVLNRTQFNSKDAENNE